MVGYIELSFQMWGTLGHRERVCDEFQYDKGTGNSEVTSAVSCKRGFGVGKPSVMDNFPMGWLRNLPNC